MPNHQIMEIACNSNCPRGFKTEDAITSNNGLALLASLTLKNVLKINNNSSIDSSSSNNNNRTNNKNKKHNIIFKQVNNQQQKQFNNVSSNKSNLHNHNDNQLQQYLGTEIARKCEQYPTSIPTAATTTTPVIHRKPSPQEQQQQKTTNGLQQTMDIDSLAQQHQQKKQKSPVTPIATNRRLQQCDGHVAATAITATSAPLSVDIDIMAPTTPSTTSKTLASEINTSATAALWEALKACKINENHSHNNKNNNNCNNNNNNNNVNNNNVNNNNVNNDNKSSNVTTTTTATSTPTTVQPNTTTTPVSSTKYFQIPSDILDDLASRFIINVPEIEQQTVIRVCFQIELAHWFYLDFFCMNEDRKLQSCGIKHFAMQLFEHIPFLRQHLPSVDTILDEWKNYKLSVPTYGAILISEDLNYCLLVQSYFAKSSWGFPKGKVNENEDPMHCAQREVYEETGFDITELLIPNDFIESVYNYQVTRLYIVQNVPLETKFIPRTRNEIKSCDWFPIDALPVNKNDAISKAKLGINANSFFMIIPFVKRLKKWVHDKRNGPGADVSAPVLIGGTSGTTVAISAANAFTLDDNNIVINNPSSSCTLSPSSLNTTLNNGQQQRQQVPMKCNTTGKKQKQSRNTSCNNFNRDDNNHKSARQNINSGNNGNANSNSAIVNVQRTLSYALTNLQPQQQQQQKHQLKQQKIDIIGNHCNNELEETLITSTATTASVTNYSKRQRHKSMGDLDGIKLNNNFHNNNNSINARKLNNNNNSNNNDRSITKALNTQKTPISTAVTTVASVAAVTTTTVTRSLASVGSQSTQKKRHLLKTHATVEAMSTSNTSYDACATAVQQQQYNNDNNNNSDFTKHLTYNKNQQHQQNTGTNDQKKIGSFELIRREKQQIKAVAVATQKQLQQQNHDGRTRTKSQGDKLVNSSSNNKNNHYNNLLNIARSSKQNNNNNNKNDHQKVNTINGNNNLTNNKNGCNNSNNQSKINGVTTATIKNIDLIKDGSFKISRASTPTQFNGQDLLEFGAATATLAKEEQQKESNTSCGINNNNTPNLMVKCESSGIPTSVKTASTADTTQCQHQQQQQFTHNRVAIMKGTDGGILQRLTSDQLTTESTTQQYQQQQKPHPLQQRPVLEFQPSFNSWTNFTFTKNFIANVFC